MQRRQKDKIGNLQQSSRFYFLQPVPGEKTGYLYKTDDKDPVDDHCFSGPGDQRFQEPGKIIPGNFSLYSLPDGLNRASPMLYSLYFCPQQIIKNTKKTTHPKSRMVDMAE
jgi:hypothetical protein